MPMAPSPRETVPNLRTGVGETNIIQLVAVADEGLLVINGEVVANLDLATHGEGRWHLARHGLLYRRCRRRHRHRLYRDFAVWVIDPAPAVTPVATAGPGTQAAFETAREAARQGPPVADLPSGELVEGHGGRVVHGRGC